MNQSNLSMSFPGGGDYQQVSNQLPLRTHRFHVPDGILHLSSQEVRSAQCGQKGPPEEK